MLMQSKFHHIGLRVKDFDKVVTFYKEVFGLTEKVSWIHIGQPAVMLKMADGGIIEIFGGGPEMSRPHSIHICVAVEDISAVYKKALAYGAEPMMEPQDFTIPSIPPVPTEIAFFYGLGGEVIELFKLK